MVIIVEVECGERIMYGMDVNTGNDNNGYPLLFLFLIYFDGYVAHNILRDTRIANQCLLAFDSFRISVWLFPGDGS